MGCSDSARIYTTELTRTHIDVCDTQERSKPVEASRRQQERAAVKATLNIAWFDVVGQSLVASNERSTCTLIVRPRQKILSIANIQTKLLKPRTLPEFLILNLSQPATNLCKSSRSHEQSRRHQNHNCKD